MSIEIARSARRKISAPAIIDPNQRYSLAESMLALRQSPAKTFNDIKTGKLRAFKEGRRTYISGAELIRASAPPEAA